MANEDLKIRNRNRAIQTAYEQFLCHGIENTTQGMLVRASGLSRASIDRYFINKADCVVQTAEMAARRISDRMCFLNDIVSSKKHTGIEILRMYLKTIKEIYCENPRQFVLVAEMKAFIYRNYPSCTAVFIRLSGAHGDRNLIRSILTLGVRDGSLRPDLEICEETVYLAEFYRELLENLAFSSNPSSPEMLEFIDRYIERTLRIYKAG